MRSYICSGISCLFCPLAFDFQCLSKFSEMIISQNFFPRFTDIFHKKNPFCMLELRLVVIYPQFCILQSPSSILETTFVQNHSFFSFFKNFLHNFSNSQISKNRFFNPIIILKNCLKSRGYVVRPVLLNMTMVSTFRDCFYEKLKVNITMLLVASLCINSRSPCKPLNCKYFQKVVLEVWMINMV